MRRANNLVLVAAVLLAVPACEQQPMQWVKSGATPADFQRDSYECERDTRAVSHTFSRGLIIPVIEAQEFANRCMASKGWYLSSSGYGQAVPVPAPSAPVDASGKRYESEERVNCTFPGTTNPHVAKVEMTAATCTRGGGVILGPAT